MSKITLPKKIPNLEINWEDPLNRGLLYYWTFRQKGGDLLRESVSGGDATINGSNAPSEGWYPFLKSSQGRSVNLNGTDDYILSSETIPHGNRITYAWWGRLDITSPIDAYVFSATGARAVATTFSGTNRPLRFYFTINTAERNVELGNYYSGASNYLGTDWHHHVVTFDGNLIKGYTDGKPVAQELRAGSVNPSSNLYMGTYDGVQRFWNGKLSDVRYYDRVLSKQEISNLYLASKTGYANQFQKKDYVFYIGQTPPDVSNTPVTRLGLMGTPSKNLTLASEEPSAGTGRNMTLLGVG